MNHTETAEHLHTEHGFEGIDALRDSPTAWLRGLHHGLHVQAGRDGTEDHLHKAAEPSPARGQETPMDMIHQQNADGTWSEAIPEPGWHRSWQTLFRWRPECWDCGKHVGDAGIPRFRTRGQYVDHWRARHGQPPVSPPATNWPRWPLA